MLRILRGISVPLLAIGAFSLAYVGSKWYANSELRWGSPEKAYHFSMAILWPNGGYHTKLVSITDRMIRSNSKSVPLDKFLEKTSVTTLPDGFIGQEFCDSEKFWTLLVGGNLGTGNRSAGSAKIFFLSPESGSGVGNRVIAESEEHRFRDCKFGKIGNRDFLVTVTQGAGYLYLYDITAKAWEIVHLPYVGKMHNDTTTLHFVELADLDGDGTNEVYVTATTPEFGRFGNISFYQEGTIYQIVIDPITGKFSKVADIGVANEFVKRIHAFHIDGNDVLLWGIEGEFSEDGSVKKPFSIYLFDTPKGSDGKVGHAKILELPHKECKEIHSWNIFWKNRPSLQIGCDNGTFYAYSYDSKTKTLNQVFRFVFGIEKMKDEYVKDSDLIQFWDIVQVHAVLGDDFDSDGRDELLVGVNNTGLYSVEFENGVPIIHELFGVARTYPEQFGRLTIFSIDTIRAAKETLGPIFKKGQESSALKPLSP